MKITLKLKIVIFYTLAVIFLMIGSLWYTSAKVHQLGEEVAITIELLAGINELELLTSDYLLFKEERPQKQWVAKYKALNSTLGSVTFGEPELQVLAGKTKESLRAIHSVFVQLSERIEANESYGSEVPRPLFFAQERLRNWMLLESRSVSEDGARMAHLTFAELVKVQHWENLLIATLALFLLTGVVAVAITTRRAIIHPIRVLQDGTKIVGQGNLDFRFNIDRNDELGDLAKSFDQMTVSLQEETASRTELEREIAERQKVEAALIKNKKILDEAQRITSLGIWELDMEGGTLFWSDEVYRIFGYQPQEFQGTYEAFLESVHPEDRAMVDEAYRSSAVEKSPYQVEHRVVRPDASIRVVQEKCEHYLNDTGEVVRSIGTVHDITEQVAAERELQRYRNHLEELVRERTTELENANKRLEGLDRMKSMFIATMSHELRTPLNSIIGFTTLVFDGLSGELNETQRQHLGRSLRAAKLLFGMVSEIIDISNIEAGRVPLNVRQVSLRDVVVEALDLVSDKAAKKELKMEMDIPPDLILTVDRQRLLQCLLNLINNAIKFTERGTVRVTAKKYGSEVAVRVSDTGIGMATDDYLRIFEPFERLQSHLAVQAGGTGLGLYLTQKLVEEVLGGSIEVESVLGEGTTFTISLPLEYKNGESNKSERTGGGHG